MFDEVADEGAPHVIMPRELPTVAADQVRT